MLDAEVIDNVLEITMQACLMVQVDFWHWKQVRLIRTYKLYNNPCTAIIGQQADTPDTVVYLDFISLFSILTTYLDLDPFLYGCFVADSRKLQQYSVWSDIWSYNGPVSPVIFEMDLGSNASTTSL